MSIRYLIDLKPQFINKKFNAEYIGSNIFQILNKPGYIVIIFNTRLK